MFLFIKFVDLIIFYNVSIVNFANDRFKFNLLKISVKKCKEWEKDF